MTSVPAGAVWAAALAHGSEGGFDPLSPLLVAATAAVALAYLAGTRRMTGRVPSLRRGAARLGPWRVVAFLLGLVTVLLALTGPVDELADHRFFWHMTQHMLLIVVAGPLLAAGSPGVALVLTLPVRQRATVARVRHALRTAPVLRLVFAPVTAWLGAILALWAWHLPAAYDAALAHDLVHVLEHASFLLTAWAFWWHVLSTGRQRMSGAVAVLYVFATTLPSAALGAVLTFAREPLYPAEAGLAAAQGVDPLVDQQLAGLVMWVPADLVYLAVSVALFLPWLTALAGSDDDELVTAPELAPDRAPRLQPLRGGSPS